LEQPKGYDAGHEKEVFMADLMSRIIRAARLDASLYEEVEADRSAIGQAVAVVVLSSLAAGIGAIGQIGLAGLLTGTLMSLLGWVIWAWLIYMIGTKMLPEPQTRSDTGELLRTIGFSSSPGLIRVVGIIPGMAVLVQIVAQIWMLVAMVIAVRQALDYSSTWRAVWVCVIGWIIQLLFLMVLFGIFGGLGG
jgi:hypothetical protein